MLVYIVFLGSTPMHNYHHHHQRCTLVCSKAHNNITCMASYHHQHQLCTLVCSNVPLYNNRQAVHVQTAQHNKQARGQLGFIFLFDKHVKICD